ncbi:uncharacterized protein LOC141529476 [Cotesia typhae]|uniref:uncharacterized protein LOC141529476 n=1 Tax=Cotesia typhae TaxID=2053667 RepID=UPI003D6920F3
MMFYEFLTMREILYEDIVKKIDVWIDKLTSFCNFLETDNKSIAILQYLSKELGTKKIKQGMKNLVIIKQALQSTEDLETVESEAPRCVVYTLDQDIASVYIVADNCIPMEIPNPDIYKILAGVLASYYAWHRNFPAGYLNLLQYLDYIILDIPQTNLSLVVSKFIRKFNN